MATKQQSSRSQITSRKESRSMNSKYIIIILAIVVILVVAAAVAFIFLYGRGGVSIHPSIFDDSGKLTITKTDVPNEYNLNFVMKNKAKCKKDDLPTNIIGFGSGDYTGFYVKTGSKFSVTSETDELAPGTEIRFSPVLLQNHIFALLSVLKTVNKVVKMVYISDPKDEKSKAQFYSFVVEVTSVPDEIKATEVPHFEKFAITTDDARAKLSEHFDSKSYLGHATNGGWLLDLAFQEEVKSKALNLVPTTPTYHAVDGLKVASFVLSWNAHLAKKFVFLGKSKTDAKLETIEFPTKFVEDQMKVEYDKELEASPDKDKKIKEFKEVFGVAYHQPTTTPTPAPLKTE